MARSLDNLSTHILGVRKWEQMTKEQLDVETICQFILNGKKIYKSLHLNDKSTGWQNLQRADIQTHTSE